MKITKKQSNKIEQIVDSLIIKEEHQTLSEATLARVISKYFDLGFIIVSSDRSFEADHGRKGTEEEIVAQRDKNKKNEKQIRKDIATAGFGFVPTYGGFREEVVDAQGNKKLVDNPEPEKSFIIPAQKVGTSKKADYKGLYRLGIALAKKYNQDSFFYKPPQDVTERSFYIDKTGKKDMTFDDVTVNDLEQIYFSRLRKANPDRRFTFLEENKKFILYIPKSPATVAEARKRYGEIFIRIKK